MTFIPLRSLILPLRTISHSHTSVFTSIATMQFLNRILVFASIAVAAVVATPIEARAPPSPCYSNQVLTWNTGQIPGDGGWIVRISLQIARLVILIAVIPVLQHAGGRVHGILMEDGSSLLQRKHKICIFALFNAC